MAATPTTTSPEAPPDRLTLGGLTGLLAQRGKQFGDTMGYQLTVFPDRADLARPDSVNAHKTVEYHFSNGGWMNLGPSPIPPDSTVGVRSKFNAQEVIGVLREAPQSLHINNATNTYLIIESEKDGSLALRLHLSDGTQQRLHLIDTSSAR